MQTERKTKCTIKKNEEKTNKANKKCEYLHDYTGYKRIAEQYIYLNMSTSKSRKSTLLIVHTHKRHR